MAESTIVTQTTDEHVAHYRIVRRICRSSLGVVYKAQEEGSKKSVAVRVVKSDALSDPECAPVFEREIDTLKHLRHPGIARVLEIGPASADECFFASDYVRGAALGEYAKMHKRSVREWLQLFNAICAAIHHAHQHGIAHRDLRPGNIIIDGNVSPRIVGLGVACLTDYDVGLPREPADWLLPFRSPEQVCGRRHEIDVRTDVYTLGVILYQLLTGQLPFHIEGDACHDWSKLICESSPKAPSSIKRSIDADLEAVLLKAIAKKPADRYQSISEFAQDIEDYLKNRPVRARPTGGLSEIGRVAARHKFVFTFAFLIFIAAFGLGIQSYLARRSADRSRLHVVKRLSGATISKLHADAEAAIAKQASAERDQRGSEQRLEKVKAETEALKAALRDARDAQLEVTAERDRAQEATGEAEKVAQFVVEMFGAADLRVTDARDIPAVTILDRAAAKLEEQFAGQPGPYAALAHHLGVAYLRLGLYDKARALLSSALHVRRQSLGDENAETVDSMYELASALFAGNHQAEAVDTLRKLIAISKRVYGDDHPRTLTVTNNLAFALHATGELDEAETLFRESLKARRRVLGPDHIKTAISMNNLAKVLFDRGKAGDAEPLFRDALAIFVKQLPEGHFRRTETTGYLGACLSQMGQYDDAEPLLLESYQAYLHGFGDGHEHTRRTIQQIASMYDAWGKRKQAAEWRSRLSRK